MYVRKLTHKKPFKERGCYGYLCVHEPAVERARGVVDAPQAHGEVCQTAKMRRRRYRRNSRTSRKDTSISNDDDDGDTDSANPKLGSENPIPARGSIDSACLVNLLSTP